MRSHLFRIAGLGLGLLSLAGCPNPPTVTPEDIDLTTSTVTVSKPTGVFADGTDSSAIEVKLLDRKGAPLEGLKVELSATGTGNTLAQPSGATNASGIATGSITSTVAEVKTISAKVGSVTLDAKPTVEFVLTPATKLAFSVQPPARATAGAALTPAVAVSFLDAKDALVPVSGTVTLRLGANPGTATLGGTLSVAAVNGVATFSDLTLDKAGTGYTLVATAEPLPEATSQAFDIEGGAAAALVVTDLPATATAGDALGFTVTARDALGNVATGYTGTVTLTATDAQATLPAAFTFRTEDAGVHAFTGLVLKTAGAQTLTAADGTLSGTGAVTVSSGAATGLLVSGMPSPVTAGTAGTVTVTAVDAFGNTDPTYAGTVALTVENDPDAAATLPAAYTFSATDAGKHDFALTLKTAGLHDVVATDGANASVSGKQSGIQVVPGAAATLLVAGLPASVESGVEQSFTVTGADAFGNTVRSYQGPVSFSTGVAGDLLPAQSMLINGTGAFKATFMLAGARTLTVGDGTLSGTATTTVTPGTVTHLAFTTQPAATTAGAALSFVVSVKDAQGNTDTGFTGQITVAKASGAGALLGTASKAAVAGEAVFGAAENLHLDVTGSYTLSASATGPSGTTSNAFDVTAGAAHHLVFSVQPVGTTAGSAIHLEVTAKDALENTATAFTGTVTLAKASGSGALVGTASKAAVAGVATFGIAENVHFDLADTYTLSASAAGVTGITSAAFDITAGTVHHLAFTVQPTNTPAGSVLNVAVTAQDDMNNTVTGFNGTVTLARASGPGALLGTAATSAVGGVATFGVAENLHLDVAGTYTLSASTPGVTAAATSNAFDVTALPAHHLVFTVQPTDTTAGSTLTVEVTAKDSLNNTATSFTGTVILAKASGPGALLGTASKPAVAGVASFGAAENLRLNTAGTYTLAASATGLTGATSTPFAVALSSTTALTFITEPANTTAGSPIQLVIAVQDLLGNTDTAFNGNVTLAKASGPGTLLGTVTKAATAGVVSFGAAENLHFDVTGTYVLTATASGPSSANSAPFDVTAAAAHHLVFTVQPTSVRAGAPLALTVTAQDALNNTATGFTGAITLAKGAGPGALLGTATKNALAGVAVFGISDNLHFDVVGTYTLSASAAGLTGATSNSFDVTAGTAHHLAFTLQPANAGAGAPITLDVTAQDALNNTVTGFNGVITLTKASGPTAGTLAGTFAKAAVAGVASFGAAENLHFDVAGTYTLTASAAGPTSATSNSFNITPGAAHHLVFSAQPANTVAGSAIALTVTAQDALNNTATAFTGNIAIAKATGPTGGVLAGTATKAAVAGVASFGAAENLRFDLTGTYTLAASATGPAGATSTSFDVIPGTAHHLVFTVQPANLTAGQTLNVTVTAQDALNNLAAGFTGAVTLATATGPGTLQGTTAKAAVAGVASFGTAEGLHLDATGTYTLSASATGPSGATSTAFDVAPGGADHLVFSVQPASGTAGTLVSVTVTAQDALNNTATAFTGAITLAKASGPTAGVLAGTATKSATAGVAVFAAAENLHIDLVGTYALSATAAGLTGATSTTFDVTPGAAHHLAFTVQPANVAAGSPMSLVVAAQDALNNTATGFSGTVTIGKASGPASGVLSGTNAKAATAGVVTFGSVENLRLDVTGTYTLSASATGLTSATSTAFDVTAASSRRLVFSTQPANTATGAPIAIELTVKDSFGNTDTSFNGSVTVSRGSGAGPLLGTTTKAATAGVVSFGATENLHFDVIGTYTLAAAATGITGATSNAFDISAGAAQTLVFTVQPGNVVAGSVISLTVVAQDGVGNQATGFTGVVTLAIAAGPGALAGTVSKAAVGGVASFGAAEGLHIDVTGTYRLTASATGVTSVTSNNFNVRAGAAHHLAFTTQPVNTPAGGTIAVSVTAQDVLNNTVTTFLGSVTINKASGPGTLLGTTSKNAVAGVVSFGAGEALRFTAAGTYTLIASANGPAAATSVAFDVTPLAAQTLVFTTPPANTTAGAPIALTVTARDALGNTATAFNGNVAIAKATGPGVLAGTATKAALAGVATFGAAENLHFDLSGTYTLSATATGLTAATSNSFLVAPGLAHHLVFTVQPAPVTAGAAIAVTVTAQDALNNTATGFTGTVTLAKETGPGALAGTAAKAAVAGVVSFGAAENLRFNVSGTYSLTASATGPTAVTSSPFNVNPGAAHHLVISTQPPASLTAGSAIALTVTAQDVLNNTATGFTGNVTITRATGPGALAGTAGKAATAGVAAFEAAENLHFDLVGTYTLTASATGTVAATTTAINVVPGSAQQLVVTTQPPASVTAGATVALTVTARDALGNTATGFTGEVTVAKGVGPGALAGTATKAAAAGVVSFAAAEALHFDLAGTYSLAVSAAGVTGATTNTFAVIPGTAHHLVYTVQPVDLTAGSTLALTVTAQDALNNTATGFTGTVTIARASGPAAGTLLGTLAKPATAGVATFGVVENLRINVAGTYTLLASAAGPAAATSDAFTVNPGAAHHLVFSAQPANTTAGETVALTVTAQDALNNTAAGFTGQVTLAKASGPGVLAGTAVKSATAGVASFAVAEDLHFDLAGTYTLSAAATGLTGATSNAFVVAPGATHHLVFTVQPAPVTAGATIALTVTAQDALNNTATGFTGTVTIAKGSGPGTLAGTVARSAVAGVATFGAPENLRFDVAGAYTVTATATGLPVITSASFNVNPGVAHHLVFSAQPPTNLTAGGTIALTVTAQDVLNNTATGFTGNVTLAKASGPAAGVLLGTTAKAASAGVVTFAAGEGLHLDLVGTYTLSASALGTTGTTSAPFTVAPGAAQRLVFSQQPVNVTAGATIHVTATAQDALGNTATGFTGEVTLAKAAGPGGLAGLATKAATAGVASFAAADGLHLDVVGLYTLTASSAGLTGATSNAFNVTPGTAHHLVFSIQPTNVSTGSALALTVTAQDALNNTATAFAGTVTLTKATGPGALLGTAAKAAAAGVVSFGALENLHFDVAGTYTLIAAATGPSPVTSDPFDVTPGSAGRLVFSAQPGNTTAGSPIALTVTAQDGLGNTATGFTGNVTIARASGPGALAGTVTKAAVAGVVSFSAAEALHFDLAGTYTLSATASGLSSATSLSFVVAPGAADHLVFTVQPAPVTAGSAIALTVTAQDALGNTATGFTGSVTIAKASGPGTLAGTAAKSAVAGVVSFAGAENLRFDQAGTYALSAAASGLPTLTSNSFAVNPGAAHHLVFSSQPANLTAGATLALTVTAQDALNNTATGFAGTVTLAKASGPAAGVLAGTTAKAAVAGVASFGAAEGVHLDLVGTYTLSATTLGATGANSTSFTVAAGAAHHLVFSVQPGNVTAGAPISLTVTAQDALNNTASAFTGEVSIAKASGPGALAGVATRTAAAGVASFTAVENLHFDLVGTYSLAASATGLTGAASSAFTVSPGTAHHLVFSVQPGDVTAGAALALTVTAQDALNNTATAFTGTVTLTKATGPGALVGTSARAAIAGVASFGATENLHFDVAGTYSLAASATGPTAATSDPFEVSPGTAHHLVFSVQPGNVTAGAPISLTVTAQDSLNNTATGFTGTITLAKATGPGTLAGAAAKAATAGVASFGASENLHFDLAGSYSLSASATGPTGATSGAFTVAPGAAHHLVFSAQPTDVTAGAAIALTVTVQDALNNTATGFAGTVTLIKDTGPGVLAGTSAKAAAAGVAAFGIAENLHFDLAGTYTLTASVSGLAALNTNSFNVNAGAVHHLVFSAQPPASVTAGAAIPLTVTAQDILNNTATGFAGTVTLAKASGPAAGALVGTTAKAATAGVASFGASENLHVDLVGTYSLSATAMGATGATSSSVNVVPGVAARLVFSTQPANVNAGATIAVAATAQDALGNTATAFTGDVTIAKASGPGALAGTVTRAAAAGVATFGAVENLRFDLVGTYSLAASATGLADAVSNAFTVTPGAAHHLVFSVQPTNVSTGSALALTVTAQDALNNTATAFGGTVTITKAAGPGTLSGTAAKAATAGVVSFGALENLNFATAGTYTLAASAPSVAAATSSAFEVTPGASDRLVFSLQPSNVGAGGAITLTVTALDSLGNPATGFTGDVTLAKASGPGALLGTVTKAATAGVASFGAGEDLHFDVAGTYTLSASATGLTSATSGSFVVAPGAAHHLVYSVQPSAVTAGGAIALTVTAQDALNNTATGFAGAVTIGKASGPGTLVGTAAKAATAGVVSFGGTENLHFDVAGTYALTASAAGLSTLTSDTFAVNPGVAHHLVFSVQPPASVTAGATIALTVTAQDALNNTATGFAGTVTLAKASGPAAGALAGTNAKAAVAGVASFSAAEALRFDLVGTYALSAASGGLTGATSSPFNVTPGVAQRLVFSAQPANTEAGATIHLTVTAQDALGNTATAYTGDVTIAKASGPGTLQGTAVRAAAAGVASFGAIENLRIGLVGTYSLSASATGLTGATSTAFNIVAAPAHHLVFTVQPTNLSAGGAIAVTVTAQDAQNNTATGFTGTVTLAKGTGPGALAGSMAKAATAGVVSFGATENVHFDVAGTYTLAASATGVTAATSSSFDVAPGAAHHLVFSVQPPANVTAGATLALTVTAQDALNNTATSFGGNVTVGKATGPVGGSLAGTLSKAATAGVASFGAPEALHIDLVGAYTLSASATGLTAATSGTVNVNPGPAQQLYFTVQPLDVAAGATIALTLTARDSLGNTATGFTGDVTVAKASGPGVLAGNVTKAAAAGVVGFGAGEALRFDAAGTYTLSASAAGVTGATSNSFAVNPGAAHHLAFALQPGTTTAGSPIVVEVRAQDALNNTATAFTGFVTLAKSTGPGALAGTLSKAATAGVASFGATENVRFDLVGTYSLTATATGPTPATSSTFSVVPGAAHHLAFSTPPSNTTAGAPINLEVRAFDALNNLATGFTGNVTIAKSSGPGLLVGTTLKPATAGVALFGGTEALNLDLVGAYTLVASADALTSATSGSFNITAGSPAALAFKVQPSRVKRLTAISPAVQVEIRDGFTNPTNATNSVTLSLAGGSPTAVLGGSLTLAAVNGAATFANLTVDVPSTGYTLNAAATGLAPAISSGFDVVNCVADGDCSDSNGCTTDTCNTGTGVCVFTGCGANHVCSPSQTCVYSHTINLADSAANDFASSSESFSTTSGGYTAYVSWDATNLYIGYSGPDVSPTTTDAASKWILVYLDFDPGAANGSSTGITYNTQNQTMPTGFLADYHYAARMDFTWAHTNTYSGGTWGTATSTTVPQRAGTYAEFAIPLASLGDPSKIGIVTLMINEKPGSEWTYAGVYSGNFSDGYNTSMPLTSYLLADFASGASPNDSANKKP